MPNGTIDDLAMAAGDFSTQTAWGLPPPCYVRQVDRKRYWEDKGQIKEKIFRPDSRKISVYQIQDAEDLSRVAIAINDGRSSRLEDIIFLAIKPQELRGAGLPVSRELGATNCEKVNLLHYNRVVKNPTQICQLIDILKANSRELKKYARADMRVALQEAEDDGCHAAGQSDNKCVCESRIQWIQRIGIRALEISRRSLFGS